MSEKVLVIPLFDAIKDKLIKFSPKSKEDINLNILTTGGNSYRIAETKKQEIPPLRDYQRKAIDIWESHDYKGILEMATGTGKTLIGVKALEIFLKTKGISIILSPTIEICNQWKNDINKFLHFEELVFVTSKNASWKKDLRKALHNFVNNRNKNIVIISTYESLNNLMNILIEYPNEIFFILGDEVHSFGSEKRSIFLEEEFSKLNIAFRLGLSATPKRLFDTEGNEKVEKFFGGIIFRYSIGDAIKDKYLSQYKYYIKPVNLTDMEYKQYLDITRKIGRNYHISKEKESKYAEFFIHQRAKIIKTAQNKLKEFEEIVKNRKIEDDTKYTLVFCIDTNQLEKLSEYLSKHKIIHSKVTGLESHSEREEILKSFSKGDIPLLLSMKILDEGVNIPQIKNAIILASSRNPREYVQRRGRVLRKSKEEKIAKIYDFLVLPPDMSHSNEWVFTKEKEIIRKEILRVFEFSKYANNWQEAFDNEIISETIKKYGLSEMYNLFLKEN